MSAQARAAADLITTALESIVADISDAGIAVTRDPGDFQPPGAIVAAPTLTGAATMQSIGLTVPVYVVSDQVGQEGLDWMLEQVTTLLPIFGEPGAVPTVWHGPINPAGLPAYLITLRVNVSTS